MRVTRWGEFGIHCCVSLARHYQQGPIGAQEIADEQQIPIQYTQQILHRLRKGGVIKSARGPHGGYRLSREPDMITLREILAAAEGQTFSVVCDDKPAYRDCNELRGACGLRQVWGDLKRTIDDFLDAKTLAALAEHMESSDPALVPAPRARTS